MAQPGYEGHDVPVPEGSLSGQALAPRRPAAQGSHVGLGPPSAGQSIPRIDCSPRLYINENKPSDVNSALMGSSSAA